MAADHQPQATEAKYFFLLGVIQGMMEADRISQDSPILAAVEYVLEDNAGTIDEATTLQMVKEFKSRPPMYPFS